MKRKLLITLLLCNSIIIAQEDSRGECSTYMSNPDFETNIPTGLYVQNNINDATGWSSIWSGYLSGEFYGEDNFWPQIVNPSVASGNYSGFWINNKINSEREGIMNELSTPILPGNELFTLSFELSVLAGYGTPEMGIYGVYNPSSTVTNLVTDSYSHSPTNMDLFGTGNVVLLGTVDITQADNTTQFESISFNTNNTGFPSNGITHIFITRTDSIFSSGKYIGVDNFCLTRQELASNQYNNEIDFNIYPNPTKGIFNVQVENTDNSIIEVINVLGKTILIETVSENITNFDLSDQPNGVYFVKVTSGNQMQVQRLIKN